MNLLNTESDAESNTEPRGSIIIAVLQSYEVVNRQLIWFSSWLPQRFPRWNLILVDDGSAPSISEVVSPGDKSWLKIIRIQPHTQPWTQPAARNRGAEATKSEFIFFTDIDHIITPEAMTEADAFTGDKLRFPRLIGALDPRGRLITSEPELCALGAKPKDLCKRGEHANTFVIRRDVHVMLGGYDEKFCGKYGGDDTDYSDRYGDLHRLGGCRRSDFASNGPIYVFPDPKSDRTHLFHDLRRKGFTEWN